MKCPVCKTIDLVMSERQNVEIDYCPECRGIWLDKSELDKIIERSNEVSNSYNTNNNTLNDNYTKVNKHEYEHNKNKYDMNNSYNKNAKKKESFISEIFEMFGGD